MSKAMRSVSVVGSDGFDGLILKGIIQFYGSAGYKVFYGSKPVEADILVWLRGPYKDEFGPLRNYARIFHVYNYVDPAFVSRFQDIILSWGDLHSCRIIMPTVHQSYSENHLLSGKIHVGMPPVLLSPFLDSNNTQATDDIESCDFVHIGNFKNTDYEKSDDKLISLIKFIDQHRVRVWGTGWEGRIDQSLIMGSLSPFKLYSVYQKAAISVGLMYSYQRSLSISGRLWEAPLSGCPIITESMPPEWMNNPPPGVLSLDISSLDVHTLLETVCKINSKPDLSRRAHQYWMAQTERLWAFLETDIAQEGGFKQLPVQECIAQQV